MPPPPNYDCPVCKKGFQRGYLARHICTHEQKDLIQCVINKDSVDDEHWHPGFDCSGHIYYICPSSRDGYEKDTLLHKRHSCNQSFKDWLNTEQALSVTVKLATVKPVTKKPVTANPVKKNIIVEESEEPINAIDMTLPEDEPKQTNHIQCTCHLEITALKNELDQLRKWRDLVLANVPQEPKAPQESKPQPKAPEPKAPEPKAPQEPKPQEPKPVVKKSTKPKIHASKKEIEKGMWCVDCAACKTTAQFATDLRPCCNCKKLTHFNDDLTGCYHWECAVCSKNSCYGCVKAAGGSKIKPLCSPACQAIYKSQR